MMTTLSNRSNKMSEFQKLMDIIARYLADNEPNVEMLLRLENLSHETMDQIDEWAAEYRELPED